MQIPTYWRTGQAPSRGRVVSSTTSSSLAPQNRTILSPNERPNFNKFLVKLFSAKKNLRLAKYQSGLWKYYEVIFRNILRVNRSEENTSELQSLMRISYAVFCLKKKTNHNSEHNII